MTGGGKPRRGGMSSRPYEDYNEDQIKEYELFIKKQSYKLADVQEKKSVNESELLKKRRESQTSD